MYIVNYIDVFLELIYMDYLIFMKKIKVLIIYEVADMKWFYFYEWFAILFILIMTWLYSQFVLCEENYNVILATIINKHRIGKNT